MKGFREMTQEIFVHLDGSGRSAARLGLAIRLAAGGGGRVTGLFARIDPDERGIVAARASVTTANIANNIIRFICGLPSR